MAIFVCFLSAWLAAGTLSAGVVVVQNYTPDKVSFVAQSNDGKRTEYTLTRTDVAAIPSDGPVIITLGEGATAITRQAPLNSILYLGLREGKPDIMRVPLPGIDDKPATDKPADSEQKPAPAPDPATLAQPQPAQRPPQKDAGIYKIPVAVLVDTADLRSRAVWEKKLRKRLDDASDIFEHHCRVRFEVVSVGIWQSNPAIHSFDDALIDFARKVPPKNARVVIGFTSRYDWQQDESHLGGTQGSLASHVLIREGVRVSEPERLEVVVHELGHFLGAAHTADQNSVMRPKLGDRRSTAKSFRIGFDAYNTLVINLIAEEMRTRHIWHASVLSPEAKTAVRGAYMALAKSIPTDPVSTSSIESLGSAPRAAGPPSIVSPEVISRAQFVVAMLANAARQNNKLPVSSKDPKQQLWRTGDELMAYYVRSAANSARQFPPEVSRSAFLLGLAVGLDESNYVRDKAALNDVWQKIEPDDQRRTRLLIMGAPTIRKQHDLVGRFTMSAALVVLMGQQGAEAAGMDKEIRDSKSGNGFSFVNLCAEMSGVMFATHIREDNITLEQVANGFVVENFVPSLDDLPEDVSWDKFQKEYGEGSSENFQKQRREIYHHVLDLPPYRAPAEKKK
jgi:hypothetical protein